jgi:hypothetical protein
MKRFLIAGVFAALFVTPAFATGLIDSHDTNNTSNANSTNVNTAVGGSGGAGGNATGGSAVNAPVTVNTNTAKIEKGAVDIDNKVSNHNTNTLSNSQRQKQHQSQSQSQEAYSSAESYSKSSVRDSGNSDVTITDIDRRQTPPAFAPSLVMGSEVCAQSQSAGGSSPVFGFSIGVTHDNAGCNMRRNAATLAALGAHNAAVELMCSDDDVRAAMKNAGTPCAADRQAAPAPTAALEPMDEPVRLSMAPIANDK